MSTAVRQRTLFATDRSRTVVFGLTVAAVAVAAVLLSDARPTRSTAADAFWNAALVAVVATFGATARRWAWFLPAGTAAAIAGDGVALGLAAVAIVIAFDSVLRDTRSPARGALATALGALALLRAGPLGFHGSTALLTAAAVVPVLVSGYRHAGPLVRAWTGRVAVVAGGVIGLMIAGAALGVVGAADEIADGTRAIDAGLEAARDADDDAAAEQLDQASRALASADAALSSWFVAPAGTLPFIGPNIDAVSSLSSQVGEVAEVTSLAADSADVDALRFVDGRLDPQVVADMQEPLAQVDAALDRTLDEVERARSPWLAGLVSSRIDELEDQIESAAPDAEAARNAVGVAPRLLGADGPQRYLVLFTTPVEARGRFGFPGNYAELVVDDGRLSMPAFGRVSELEQAGVPGDQRTLEGSPEMMARYGRFGITSTWRNLTMTPDLPSLARAAAELYPQSGGQPIDGLLVVDPTGLAALMRHTGPVQVEGRTEPLTADNVEQYLLFDQYLEFADANDDRVDVLETVARTSFERLASADLPGPRALSEQLAPIVDGGHIQFATLDEATFLPLRDMGITGELPRPGGNDTVTVTTSNGGGSKIDLFLHRRERYDVRWDPATGAVSGTFTLTLENGAPAEGLPDYVIGNAVGLPWGTNRSYVSVYSPFALDGARLGGQPVELQPEVELGRNVYSTFLDIPPGGTVELELDLRGTIEGRRYRLDLPSQPFAEPDQVEVTLEVAGVEPVARGEGVSVAGNTVSWSTVLDVDRSLSVTAPRE